MKTEQREPKEQTFHIDKSHRTHPFHTVAAAAAESPGLSPGRVKNFEGSSPGRKERTGRLPRSDYLSIRCMQEKRLLCAVVCVALRRDTGRNCRYVPPDDGREPNRAGPGWYTLLICCRCGGGSPRNIIRHAEFNTLGWLVAVKMNISGLIIEKCLSTLINNEFARRY